MNKYVSECSAITEHFNIQTIPISYKNEINSYKISFLKIKIILELYIKLIISIIRFKPKFIYFQISPLGIAFIRDCSFIFIMKIFRMHVVYHLHGKGINEAGHKSKFYKLLYKWAFKGSSVICLAESLISDISEIYSKKPFIVPNAIPKVNIDIYSKSKNEKFKILFLSNLIVSKGILVFLDAIQLLNKEHIEKTEIYIVGKEVDLNEHDINYEISKRSLQNFVKYLGPKYNEEKNKILANTDLLIYPTLNDVWGLVILEAMQFGIPIIASREGAISEIVEDGITGFLVDKHESYQIVEKLETLIDNPILRHKMGGAGQEKFFEKYTIDFFEKNMLSVFNNVINTL